MTLKCRCDFVADVPHYEEVGNLICPNCGARLAWHRVK